MWVLEMGDCCPDWDWLLDRGSEMCRWWCEDYCGFNWGGLECGGLRHLGHGCKKRGMGCDGRGVVECRCLLGLT